MKDKYKKYIEYIVSDIQVPYIKYLNMYELKQEEMVMVLSKVYNQPVTIKGNWVYNTDGNKIYLEYSNGNWEKSEYDKNGNRIYFENNSGYWVKHEYDHNGNEVYVENSRGYIEDNR